MKRIHRILFLLPVLTAALCLSGCAGIERIKVESASVKSFRMLGLGGAELNAEIVIDNPLNKKIVLKSCSGVVKKGEVELISFEVNDTPLTVGKKAVTTLPVKVTAKILNPGALLLAGLKFDEASLTKSGLTLSGDAALTFGGVRKKFTLKDFTASQLFRMFGRWL